MPRADSFSGFFHARSAITDFVRSNEATHSAQQQLRLKWRPQLPLTLDSYCDLEYVNVGPSISEVGPLFPNTMNTAIIRFKAVRSYAEIQQCMRVGVVLSGGPASGGHNVIAGLYDFIKRVNPKSQLIGFLNGPHGVFTHNYREIIDEDINRYRNMGGFDMICSGRHKIETEDQKQKSLEVCETLNLKGLVIIGGDDSNTNAAILAEYFRANKSKTVVVGVPKTIDGDLKNEFVEISFGFDTACRTYSEMIGNLCLDAVTSQDRYHFVRLMGRAASNIALECALQTRANLTFISEAVKREKRSLKSICSEIVDLVVERSRLGKFYGVILLPEGLIEFIPEMSNLISDINEVVVQSGAGDVVSKLKPKNADLFRSLPAEIAQDLLLDRDSHGNVQVSRISTEKLIVEMVQQELELLNFKGRFFPTTHFFGYEGRCAMPSNFDATYCYSLGYTAGHLVYHGVTGYMAVVGNLKADVVEWLPGGCPITMMMNVERRKGSDVPVIKKYLVELDKPLYKSFAQASHTWRTQDLYRNPGPLQYNGVMDLPYMICHAKNEDLLPVVDMTNAPKINFWRDSSVLSRLQRERLRYRVPIASILINPKARCVIAKKCDFNDPLQEKYIRRYFPLQSSVHDMRAIAVDVVENSCQKENSSEDSSCSTPTSGVHIGVVLLGQAVPGVGNILSGLLDRLALSGGHLVGFKGVSGLLSGETLIINKTVMINYNNLGGCEILGRTPMDRDAIREESSLPLIANSCTKNNLNGLVIIGGKYSLTDAALITEYFLNNQIDTKVVGVPAIFENNIRHPLLEHSIGFDSTTKTCSSIVGNILTDSASVIKYWHFIRLLGHKTSHVVVETALQTHPNFVVVTEKYSDLEEIITEICNVVVRRSVANKNYGSVLIPDGLLLGLDRTKRLLNELESTLMNCCPERRLVYKNMAIAGEKLPELSVYSSTLIKSLPKFFIEEMFKPTTTGRLDITGLSTEQLVAEMVGNQLKTTMPYMKIPFNTICHYVGFQGRPSLASSFDCALAAAHGHLAAIVVESGLTGMFTSVRGLCGKPTTWRFSAVPITALTRVLPEIEEKMFGKRVPIVPGYDVDLTGKSYEALAVAMETVSLSCQIIRLQWEIEDRYCNPGPIQFCGPLATQYSRLLHEEQFEYMSMLESFETLTAKVAGICSFGVRKDTLKTSLVCLKALADVISDKH